MHMQDKQSLIDKEARLTEALAAQRDLQQRVREHVWEWASLFVYIPVFLFVLLHWLLSLEFNMSCCNHSVFMWL